MKQFSDFNLKDSTYDFIRRCGFSEPTDIQEKIVPLALRGKDIIAVSQTGSGKTHAYLIPLMEKINPRLNHVQAVIVAPTRELAEQIYQMAVLMTEADPMIRLRSYIGGRDRGRDMEKISGEQPHIVIGTPGRIKDLFLSANLLRLDLAETFVVDEADMALEYGFLDDIDAFAGKMSEDLQMMVFSATIPDQLKPFLKKYMHHPITVRTDDTSELNPNIRHILVPCYHHSFEETILSILPGFRPYTCMIFTNTRTEAETIAEYLRKNDYDVTELHGNLESRKRRQAMRSFVNHETTYLVCTDLAARGIDNDTVSHVISCGFPADLNFYIHRSGRTGRAGADGICYALYHEEDDASIRTLMKQGISFEHARYRADGWQKLRKYGMRRTRRDSEMDKQISMMLTKKNTKVKPGYKKKRAAAIEKLQQKKRRDYIREKIREEKKERYKMKARGVDKK